MSGLVVNREICVGCRRCERVCANDGIEVRERKAYVLDGCISCGMCVDACPVSALSIEKDSAASADISSYHDIWVYCQWGLDGEPLPVAYELLAKGRELAQQRNCKLIALFGGGAKSGKDGAAHASTPHATFSSISQKLLEAGADEVLISVDENLSVLDAQTYAAWIVELANQRKPEVIIYGATNFGRELAPRVAVLLQTGLTADCTVLEMDSETGLLQQTRPAFGGNLMATIVCPQHRPQMATVRPGIFAAAQPTSLSDEECRERTHEVAVSISRPKTTHETFTSSANANSITDAEVLVVVGRGIGSKKAIKNINELAGLLAKRLGTSIAVGCTRPVVEAGWLDYSHQVGQTGVSVAPKLLISIGVSGAIQHLSGISGAQTIVAINEDATAPIFGVAQYKLVADCHKVVASLLQALQEEPCDQCLQPQ